MQEAVSLLGGTEPIYSSEASYGTSVVFFLRYTKTLFRTLKSIRPLMLSYCVHASGIDWL
jgi:hypothetical protein